MNLPTLGLGLAALPVAALGYAYALYPLALRAVAGRRDAPTLWPDPPEWPRLTIAVPAYNEEARIAQTLESLLALDYPADRKQIVVMSDCSSDRTDEIVRGFADRGVVLVRMDRRMGKGAMENVAAPSFTGDIVVNTDATIRILPESLKPLIRVFQDPTIGAASGRDVSVGSLEAEVTKGEQGYVDYEMELRALETRAGGIIGASGCFYAIRRHLVRHDFPAELSRDFAAPLHARLAGFRTVSVDEALCLVPRSKSLQAEFRRKIRTMARGLRTLFAHAELLNPLRHGRFAWMLFSHKLARWLVFLLLPLFPLGLVLALPGWPLKLLVVAGTALAALLGLLAFRWPAGRTMPRLVSLPGFATLSCTAGFLAWMRALRGANDAIWEPTRR